MKKVMYGNHGKFYFYSLYFGERVRFGFISPFAHYNLLGRSNLWIWLISFKKYPTFKQVMFFGIALAWKQIGNLTE